MATPRKSAKAGIPAQPPFGKSKSNVPNTSPQPPIPTSRPSKPSVGKGKPFGKPGAPSPGMKGFGGKK